MPGRIQPPRHKKLKDRTEENIPGAAPEPYVTALKFTKDNAVLQCKVRGAFPKPQLQWQDRGGNIVPAEEPQVTESEGRYDVILNTTVTKTDTYRCVVTQEEINHQVHTETYVNLSGAVPEPPFRILGETNNGMQLQCEVRDAFPKPHLQLQDSAGNIIPAEEPQVTVRGRSYDILLQTTVTKTDHYRCVVTQKEINHQVSTETYVTVPGSGSPNGWVIAVVVLCVVVVVVLGVIGLCRWCKKRRH